MRKKVALITGTTGQDGSYLADLLLEKGYIVHGTKRRSSSFNTARIDHLFKDPHEDSNFHLHYCDLTDSLNISRLFSNIMPDEVYNLAAQSHVAVSFKNPNYSINTSTTGTTTILEAVKNSKKIIKYYQASSSEMFGGNSEEPLNENSLFDPKSPYAAGKVFSHNMTKIYRESYDLFCSNGILFNHESPFRGETFVTRKITRAVGRIAFNLQDKLTLGNLEAKRDWGFAGDYVKAMWLMLQNDSPDDFVIATGKSYSVRDFAEKAFKYAGLNWEEYVMTDKVYFRPNEVDFLLGDYSKAKKILNWTPNVDIDQLVKIMVDSDMEIAEKEKVLFDKNLLYPTWEHAVISQDD